MRTYKAMHHNQSLTEQLNKLLFLIISICLIYATTVQLVHASNKPIGIIQADLITLQSMHNQLYFFVPGLALSWMLVFKKPTHVELFILVNQNKLGYFMAYKTLKALLLFVAAIIISSALVLMNYVEIAIFDLANLPLGIMLLLLHLTGIICYWSILAFLSLIFNKLISLTIFSLIISIDYWLFNLFSWSFFLSNGLSLTSMDYGLMIFSNLALYLGYVLLFYYLQPHILKRVPLL